mmetsp:Transcript_22789/g.39005  ORF Transcript_22789/g.39005 Transcript_22789/m.39005 type:complete len:269 (-) Transcript_22789:589-1395(-)
MPRLNCRQQICFEKMLQRLSAALMEMLILVADLKTQGTNFMNIELLQKVSQIIRAFKLESFLRCFTQARCVVPDLCLLLSRGFITTAEGLWSIGGCGWMFPPFHVPPAFGAARWSVRVQRHSVQSTAGQQRPQRTARELYQQIRIVGFDTILAFTQHHIGRYELLKFSENALKVDHRVVNRFREIARKAKLNWRPTIHLWAPKGFNRYCNSFNLGWTQFQIHFTLNLHVLPNHVVRRHAKHCQLAEEYVRPDTRLFHCEHNPQTIRHW